jgi:uncharacterized membrane protein YedE/YeeE
MPKSPHRFWNPYLGGVALGIVLLVTFAVMGKGLGASSAALRAGVWAVNAVAPSHVASVPGMAPLAQARHPLDDWIVFEVFGMAAGGAIGAFSSGRFRREIARGPTFGAGPRLALAVGGGVLMGFAARLAHGCTSGQALSGGAVMSAGAWAFMFSVFAGGYGMAWFVRRQWR